MKFFRASTSNGPTKHHIILEDEIKSLCGTMEGRTRTDGKLNKRRVIEINDLSSKPDEKWCQICKSKYLEEVNQ